MKHKWSKSVKSILHNILLFIYIQRFYCCIICMVRSTAETHTDQKFFFFFLQTSVGSRIPFMRYLDESVALSWF